MPNTVISELIGDAQSAVRIIGYPRSGQHAISHWLFSQMSGQSLWLNNIQGTRFDKVYYYNGGVDVKTEEPIKLIGLGYEGPASRKEFRGLPTIRVRRDLRNHVASIVKHKHIALGGDFWNCWHEYHTRKKEPNDIDASFSLWCKDRVYRRLLFEEICKKAGIGEIFCDNGRETLLGSGGGSSFDAQKLSGHASKMDVLNRWQQVDIPELPSDLVTIDKREYPSLYKPLVDRGK